MRAEYPVVMSAGDKYVVVYIPDFELYTQGVGKGNAREMAYDMIGLAGIDIEDDGEEIPEPSDITEIKKEYPGKVIELVGIDFDEYREMNGDNEE